MPVLPAPCRLRRPRRRNSVRGSCAGPISLAVACIALLAAGYGGPEGGRGRTPSKPLARDTPPHVLKAALAAAKKSGAAHYVLESISPATGSRASVDNESGGQFDLHSYVKGQLCKPYRAAGVSAFFTEDLDQ
jgi:hypothetical protein